MAIFIAAFIGYTFFFKGSGVPASLTTEKPLLAQSNVKGKDLLKVLLSLNNIKLDEEVFFQGFLRALKILLLLYPRLARADGKILSPRSAKRERADQRRHRQK